MKITTFCLCILGSLAGVWLADFGAWASAGGIWAICLILAIDGGFRSITIEITKNINSENDRQRTLSTPGGLARSTVAPPPPPKKPVNPFKVGDKALAFGKHEGMVIRIAGASVKIITDDNKVVWVPSRECELICEKQS